MAEEVPHVRRVGDVDVVKEVERRGASAAGLPAGVGRRPDDGLSVGRGRSLDVGEFVQGDVDLDGALVLPEAGGEVVREDVVVLESRELDVTEVTDAVVGKVHGTDEALQLEDLLRELLNGVDLLICAGVQGLVREARAGLVLDNGVGHVSGALDHKRRGRVDGDHSTDVGLTVHDDGGASDGGVVNEDGLRCGVHGVQTTVEGVDLSCHHSGEVEVGVEDGAVGLPGDRDGLPTNSQLDGVLDVFLQRQRAVRIEVVGGKGVVRDAQRAGQTGGNLRHSHSPS